MAGSLLDLFVTPKAGEKVDKQRLTQVGRALKELSVQMIPAYSPQTRDRSERSFGTWQGRLPQELRIAKIETLEDANRFLRERSRNRRALEKAGPWRPWKTQRRFSPVPPVA